MPTYLLTPEQTADRTRLSKSTLAKLRCRGGGPPFVKLGARVLYVAAELDEWVAAQTVFRSTSEYVAPQRRRPGRPRRTQAAPSANT